MCKFYNIFYFEFIELLLIFIFLDRSPSDNTNLKKTALTSIGFTDLLREDHNIHYIEFTDFEYVSTTGYHSFISDSHEVTAIITDKSNGKINIHLYFNNTDRSETYQILGPLYKASTYLNFLETSHALHPVVYLYSGDQSVLFNSFMIAPNTNENVQIQLSSQYYSLHFDGSPPSDIEPSQINLQNKSVTYNTNGQFNVIPDINEGYDALGTVNVDVDVPIPSIRGAKSEFIDRNGTYEITAGGSWDALEKAIVTVNVPTGSQTNVETNKSVSYAMNGDFTVVPSTGYDAIGSVSVSVDVPSDINNQEKSLQPTENHVWYTIEPDAGYTGLSKVTIRPNITPVLEDRKYTILTNKTQTIYPQSGYEGMSSIEITTNVQPKLEERTVSITSNGTTEITPQGLAVQGISKVTINTNVPTGTTSVPKATKIRYDAQEYYITGFTHATQTISEFSVAPGNALIMIREDTERYAIYTWKNESTNTGNIYVQITAGEYYMSFLDRSAVFYFIGSDGTRYFGTNDNDNKDNYSSSIFIYKNICTLDL